MTAKSRKRLLKIIKKYRDAILLLVPCVVVIIGAALAKYQEQVQAFAYFEYPKVSYLPTEVEVPRPANCNSEKCKILAYIIEKFQKDADKAIILVGKCENSTFDQSRTNSNKNGTTDWGIFQINDVHVKRYGDAFKTDWKANVDVAYEIYKSHGNKFTAWTCATVVGQTNYLGRSK